MGIARPVIDWFAVNGRDLPWRKPDFTPWGALVSEFMLQQTPVNRVLPKLEEWLARWPTPADLAGASQADAVRAWDRLGYPRRALNLHATAVAIVERYDGVVPSDVDELLTLPGVGDYTARAVSVFAYGQRHPVVDVNIRRVVARAVLGLPQPGAAAKRDLVDMEALLPESEVDARLFNAGIMELGALVCVARSPRCEACPIADDCRWRALGYPDLDAPTARKQAKYEGSDRQVRGLVLAELRSTHLVVTRDELATVWPEAEQLNRSVAGLLLDRLIVETGDGYQLPGNYTLSSAVPSQTVSSRSVDDSDELAKALAAIPEKLGLARAFPPEVQSEAERIAAIDPLPELDRTDLGFVTIDPAGSTDLDQAMCLERDGDGYRVYYAIADVPAFVEPGGAIDAEARRRGQTIYAPDGRIPLHPAVISEGVASLLPNEVRGAYVWDLELDSSAEVTHARLYRARVQSVAQLDYESVQAQLDAGTATPLLGLLKEIGEKRVLLEEARGGASLRVPETEVSLVDGRYSISRRSPLPVEQWNAQLSLMTGMTAAKLMLGAGVGILRTMPEADPAAIERFRLQARALGRPWPTTQRYGDYLRSLEVNDPRQLAIMHAAASLFRGAGYSAFDGSLPEETMQAAVAAPYAHVTAPLRRLVDRFGLVLCEAISAGEPIPDWVRDALPALPGIMNASNSVSGQLDNRALDIVEAAVLSSHVGEQFAATVLSSGKGRSTIQLDDPPVTVRIEEELEPGSLATVQLDAAHLSTATVQFKRV